MTNPFAVLRGAGWLWLPVGLSVVSGLVAFPVAGQPLGSFSLASGPEEGSYHRLGTALAEETQDACARCRIRVVSTQGSYDNAALFRSGAADIALLQSDVAYLEHFEGRPFEAIASLYTEPIHVVVRKELGLERLSELVTSRGVFRVSVGPEGSGTASNALTLLEELRAPPGHFEKYRYGLDAALEKMRAREIDVLFMTAAPPVRALTLPARRNTITLLEIDGDIARRLIRRYPFFSQVEIPYQAYGTRKRSVRTLGPKTLLVVGKRATPELIRGLLDSLYRIASQAGDRELPALAGLIPEAGLDGIPIPVHSVSESYHEERASRLAQILRKTRIYALPVIVLLTPLLVLFRLSKVAYFVHQFVLGRILALLVAIWLIGSAAMYLIEGSKNSSFRSFGQSAIAILHYLFSGLEAKYPITLAGNIVAIIILSLGVAVVTLFTATLVTILVERVLNVRRLRPKPWSKLRLKGHVILVGWSKRAERVVAQLRSPDLVRRPPVVVVASDRKEAHVSSGKTYRNTWLVEGDVAKRETLERANVETASAAILMSSGAEEEERDLVAVSTTLAIETLAPQVRTVVEVQSNAAVQHLRHSRADEVVQIRALGERMLSQCVITPGITDVFSELVTFGSGSQEIYAMEPPSFLRGNGFRRVQRELLEDPVIPLGYRVTKDGETRTVLNPKAEGEGERADRLIVVADRPEIRRRKLRFPWSTSVPSRAGRREDMHASKTDVAPEIEQSPPRSRVGICGWNEEARAVVDQLREPTIACHHEFLVTVICDPARESLGKANGSYHDNVTFVVGDPCRRRVLENAGLSSFDDLVILGNEGEDGNAEHADHRSLMIALAAHDLRPDLHTVVEVLDSENREHFERLANVEIVSIQELSEKLLAQAAISPGITEVFMELLTATEDSNEVYIVPVPDRWVGWSFQSIYGAIVESGEPVVPLGYRVSHEEDGRPVVVLNPGQKPGKKRGVVNWRGYELRGADSLVLVAYEEPRW